LHATRSGLPRVPAHPHPIETSVGNFSRPALASGVPRARRRAVEREQVRGLDLVRRRRDRVGEADVADELVEDAAGQVGRDVEPDRPEVVGVVESVRSDRTKVKKSSSASSCAAAKSAIVESSSSARPRSMSRVGRAPRVEAEVERERALQDPTVGRHGDQPAQEELEGTRFRRRAMPSPDLLASALSLSSRAWRNAAAVAYFIGRRDSRAASRWRASSDAAMPPA
jgi:hypothetical protein